MRTIRSLTPFVACAALVLVASSAGAVTYYTFLGKLTENRGRNTNVPMAGNTGCGSLTVFEGPFDVGMVMLERGVNTQPQAPLTPAFDWMVSAKDLGCVKHAGVIATTGGGGIGKGKAFTVVPKAFRLPYPKDRAPAFYMFKTDIPVVEIKNFAPAVQLATSVNITAPPTVRAHHNHTQAAATAPFRKFKAGAYASQTGRLGPVFAWCPPPLSKVNKTTNFPGDTACTATHADFKVKVDYKGAGAGFGGTMSLVTHQVSGVGSLALGIGLKAAFNNFGGGESLPTGAGYGNRHFIMLPAGDIFNMFAKSTRYIGPKLGSQNVLKTVATPGTFAGMTMFPGGTVYDWGFPWTTMTVVVKKPVAGMTSTITAKGWDCAGGMQGPGCSVTTGVGGAARNISLVAGGVGIARLGAPFGDSPTVNIGSMQMIMLPEPGEALQLLAGALGLLGIAAWRARQVR